MDTPHKIPNKKIPAAALKAADYLLDSAAKADKKKFHRVMAKVAVQAPDKEDK